MKKKLAVKTIQVDSRRLAQAVELACGATKATTTLPILSHCLLSAIGSQELQVYATDLDLYVEVRVPAQVGEPGTSVAVNASILKQLLSTFATPQILTLTLRHDGETIGCDLLYKNGKGRLSIPGLPAEEYPSRKEPNRDLPYQQVQVSGPSLQEALQQIMIAPERSSYDESGMSGVHLSNLLVETNKIQIVATDGTLLALAAISTLSPSQSDFSATLPFRAAWELRRILMTYSPTVVTISVQGWSIVVEFEGVRFCANGYTQKYIDYAKVVSVQHQDATALETKPFLSAIRSILAIVPSKEDRGVIELHLGEEPNTAMLRCRGDKEGGEVLLEGIATTAQQAHSFGLIGKQIKSILGQIETEFFSLETTPEGNSLRIVPLYKEGNEGCRVTYTVPVAFAKGTLPGRKGGEDGYAEARA